MSTNPLRDALGQDIEDAISDAFSGSGVYHMDDCLERAVPDVLAALVEHREQVLALLGMEQDAQRAVAWVVASCGGQVTVPEAVMRSDFTLTTWDTVEGHRVYAAAFIKEGPNE